MWPRQHKVENMRGKTHVGWVNEYIVLSSGGKSVDRLRLESRAGPRMQGIASHCLLLAQAEGFQS